MEDKNEQIDLLLERNTTEQLETVDWDRLNAAISRRLDQAQQSKTSGIGWPTVIKIAAGLAAAVAIVLVAVKVRTDTPPTEQFENRGSAVVKFVDSKGSASIQIKQARIESQVLIDIGGSSKDVAKCDIEIIDMNGDQEQESSRAVWIIIHISQPALADNGISQDEKDLICLL
jgi:hypothetical protein